MRRKHRQAKGKYEAPKRKLAVRRDRESAMKRNGFKLDLFTMAILFFCMGVFYLASVGMVSARNQQIEYTKAQIEQQQVVNERLSLEIGYLGTLEKVEQQAQQGLAMQRPTVDQMVQVSLRVRMPHPVEDEDGFAGILTADQRPLSLAQGPLSGILNRWIL